MLRDINILSTVSEAVKESEGVRDRERERARRGERESGGEGEGERGEREREKGGEGWIQHESVFVFSPPIPLPSFLTYGCVAGYRFLRSLRYSQGFDAFDLTCFDPSRSRKTGGVRTAFGSSAWNVARRGARPAAGLRVGQTPRKGTRAKNRAPLAFGLGAPGTARTGSDRYQPTQTTCCARQWCIGGRTWSDDQIIKEVGISSCRLILYLGSMMIRPRQGATSWAPWRPRGGPCTSRSPRRTTTRSRLRFFWEKSGIAGPESVASLV